MKEISVGQATRSTIYQHYSYPIAILNNDNTPIILFKRYSDFVTLHQQLCEELSEAKVIIPSIPERKWDGRSRIRERRRIAFQYLLNWCLIHCVELDVFKKFLNQPTPIIANITQTTVTPSEINRDSLKIK